MPIRDKKMRKSNRQRANRQPRDQMLATASLVRITMLRQIKDGQRIPALPNT
jgi:hypothetical protein